MEMIIIPLVMIALLAGFAWADVSLQASATMRRPRYEPECDMPPLEVKRNPWFSVWA